MSNCNCHTPVNRDGSGRLHRYLTALDPAYTKIDGRSQEEILVFIKKYAAQIRFSDIPESNAGNPGEDKSKISWREFFSHDLSVIAASILLTDLQAFKTEYEENRQQLEIAPTPHHYGNLFDPILGMAAKIDGWFSLALPGLPLYEDLRQAILSGLKPAMKKIRSYEDAFRYVDARHPLNLQYDPIQNDELWGITDEIIPDHSIYAGTTTEKKILNASLYADDLFNTFYSVLSNLVNGADKYWQYAKEQYPAHQPHLSLFLAFLQLFAIAQEQMNGITERMLNFYYRDILHLEEKPSIPDKVHIVFELAKDIMQYDIASGTLLDGGKDNSGNNQEYKTTTDLVVNQAKVAELKTIFIQKGEIGDAATRTMVTSIDAIYARPVAKSADGFGEKITDPGGKWNTFGKGTPEKIGKLDTKNPCTFIEKAAELESRKDLAQAGFAIASPQLLLQGGKRILKIHIDSLTQLVGNITVDMANPTSPFLVYLTGEKEWLDAGHLMEKAVYEKLTALLPSGVINPGVSIDVACHYIDREGGFIFIYLPVAAAPVIRFDAAIHTGYNIQTIQPVLRVMLNKDFAVSEANYKKISFSSIKLEVQVGSIFPNAEEAPGTGIGNDLIAHPVMLKKLSLKKSGFLFFDGLKKLVLQNEDGLLSADKQPFDPFTGYPFPGKSFYAGSEEIFNKPLGQLSVNILKTQDKVFFIDDIAIVANDGVAGDTGEYGISLLQNRSWKDLTPFDDNDGIFTREQLTHNILNVINFDAASTVKTPLPLTHPRLPIIEPVIEWSQSVSKGFLRITNRLTLRGKDNQSNFLASQDMAPEMQIKEISVNYHSELLSLETGTDQFFHIYPFGAAETYINTPQHLKLGTIIKYGSAGALTLNTRKDFDTADKEKGYLLVQAYNALLPQFTWTSNYAAYTKKAAERKRLVKGDLMPVAGVTVSQFDYERIFQAGAGLTRFTAGNNQYSGTIQEEGMLFIGLEKLEPLQTVSLLFQFADGSAADEDNDPPPIHWSYLTNNEWRPLKEENLVSDSTYGFQTTGIIKIDVPADATNNNTIITNGLHWFMASVLENSHRIPMLIDVVTQAAEAVFIDNNNDQTHFDKALPAGTIGKLSVAVAEVSKVAQPFASFDGKHKEKGKEFYMRVSERLRHKGRAINAWDYEHLVLDRFPSVYKVKAINHTDPECLCRTAKKRATPALPPPAPKMEIIKSFQLTYNENLEPVGTTQEQFLKIREFLKKDTSLKPNLTIMVESMQKADEATQKRIDAVGERIKEEFKKNGIEGAGSFTLGLGKLGEAKIDIYGPAKKEAGEVKTKELAKLPLAFDPNDSHKAENEAAIRRAAGLLKDSPAATSLIEIFIQDTATAAEQAVAARVADAVKKQMMTIGISAARINVSVSKGVLGTGLITVIEEVEVIPGPVIVSNTGLCCGPQIAPGHVLIVPIADLKNRNAVNPLQPKTGRRTLLEIEAYLKMRVSPFVKVHAKNPVYEQIITAFRVKFYTSTDKGFYMKKLNEEIVHYLTPWAFDDTAEVKFGGAVYASSIINFIEERPYVDFITDFVMFVCRDECCPPPKETMPAEDNGTTQKETVAAILNRFCNCRDITDFLQSDDAPGLVVAEPATPRSILVSVAQHIIIPYEEPPYVSPCDRRAAAIATIKDSEVKEIADAFSEKPAPVKEAKKTKETVIATGKKTASKPEKKKTAKAVPVSKKKK
jgi:hypothetical protein